MAGGIGSRFWPMSTPECPKQFIDVLGSVAETMITNNYADHIYTLSKGISWITFQNECAAIRIDDQLCKQGKGITLYSSFKQNLKGDKIYTVFEDSEGDEWILTNKGISIIGKKQVDSDFPFQYIKEADGLERSRNVLFNLWNSHSIILHFCCSAEH